MCKIYQKMYSGNKKRSEGVLGGFMDRVILRSCNSGSRSFERIKRLRCRVKASRHDDDIQGCRVKASRHDDDINGANINEKIINDDNIHNVILRSRNSGSRSYFAKRTGFTLIELLVVVLIIGILAAIALPQYEKTVERARAAEAIQMVSSIAKANEVYKLANGSYTADISLLDIQLSGTEASFNGWPRKETKLFQYGAQANYYPNSVAIGRRIGSGFNTTTNYYTIAVLSDGKIICHYTSQWKDFCRSLGSGKVYSSNSYIIN